MNKISDKSQNNILNSRQRILNTASGLFSEFGFSGVSMETIAKKLDITKPAIYYHFKNKKELYLEVLEKSFQGLIKAMNKQVSKAKSPEEIISQLVRGYLNFSLKETNLIKCLILKIPKENSEITNYIIKLREKINKQLQTFLRGVFKKYPNFHLTKKINLKFITSLLLGIMDRLILESTLAKKKINIKKNVSEILKIIKPILKLN
jgi:AcrR family transcriptional regulator